MSVIKETQKNMEAAIEHLKHELQGIRTGQANPAILEGVMVDAYGSLMRLKDVATISSPEPRQLLVSPFDASNKDAIGKAIEAANLGFRPIVDGNAVRINIPPMDESVRNEMVKMCHKKREDAKISIRNVRRESNDQVKRQKNEGDIGEDIMKKLEKEIQELTDKFCKIADELSADKEKQVSTI